MSGDGRGDIGAIPGSRQRIAQAGGTPSGIGAPSDQGDDSGQADQHVAQTGGHHLGVVGRTEPGRGEAAGARAPWDKLHTPQRLDGSGIGVDIGREGRLKVGGRSTVPFPGDGMATVSCREVYAEYARQPSAALEASDISGNEALRAGIFQLVGTVR